MQVSISKAAKMVGIKSRSTFYRHIDKKGISVTQDEEGNPQIDTAELIRVYGDKVKLPGEGQGGDTKQDTQDTPKTKQVIQNNTPKNLSGDTLTELQVIREKLRALEEYKESLETERRKERELLNDQIETLKKTLNESQINKNASPHY